MAFYHTPTRRNFLRQSIGSAAVAAGIASFGSTSWAQATRIRWAILSDIHIPTDVQNEYRGFRPYENLQKVAPIVAESGVAGALVNGDLARLEGFASDYANVKKLLKPIFDRMPVALAMGNHDNVANFSAVITDSAGESQAFRNKHVVTVDAGPVRLVVLDSLLRTNLTGGLLGKEQCAWLQQYLPTVQDKPVVVCLHHTLGDRDGDLFDTDRFLGILTANRNVKALIYGHSHRYHYDVVNGVHMINVPAIGYNFSDTEPVGWVHAEFGKDGADFRLNAFGGNRAADGKITSLTWRS